MPKKNTIDLVYEPILPYLSRVQKNIREQIKTQNKTVDRVVDYIFQTKGKLLRPALVILAAKAASPDTDEKTDDALVQLATAIELIHNASLVHDDILDNAAFRRDIPTLNKSYNNHVALLAGDALFSLAFYLMTHHLRQEIIEPVTQITAGMCHGEIINELYPGENLDFDTYLTIIKLKTAGLMGVSTRSGAMLVNADDATVKTLHEYGMNIGIVYQIVDDYVDDETAGIEGFSLDYAIDAGRRARSALQGVRESIYKQKLTEMIDLFIEMSVQKDMSTAVKLP